MCSLSSSVEKITGVLGVCALLVASSVELEAIDAVDDGRAGYFDY